jgi:hypothetical protein
MTKAELIDAVAKSAALTKASAEKAVGGFISAVTDALKAGGIEIEKRSIHMLHANDPAVRTDRGTALVMGKTGVVEDPPLAVVPVLVLAREPLVHLAVGARTRRVRGCVAGIEPEREVDDAAQR